MLIEGQRQGLPPGITHCSLEEGVDKGMFIVGSPETALRLIQRKKAAAKINVLMGFFRFGSLPKAQTFASIRLFAEEVLPKIRAL